VTLGTKYDLVIFKVADIDAALDPRPDGEICIRIDSY
jgi:hypothetical protein